MLKMDVESDESIDEAYDRVVEILGDEGLNMVFNNAGLGGRVYFFILCMAALICSLKQFFSILLFCISFLR